MFLQVMMELQIFLFNLHDGGTIAFHIGISDMSHR